MEIFDVIVFVVVMLMAAWGAIVLLAPEGQKLIDANKVIKEASEKAAVIKSLTREIESLREQRQEAEEQQQAAEARLAETRSDLEQSCRDLEKQEDVYRETNSILQAQARANIEVKELLERAFGGRAK